MPHCIKGFCAEAVSSPFDVQEAISLSQCLCRRWHFPLSFHGVNVAEHGKSLSTSVPERTCPRFLCLLEGTSHSPFRCRRGDKPLKFSRPLPERKSRSSNLSVPQRRSFYDVLSVPVPDGITSSAPPGAASAPAGRGGGFALQKCALRRAKHAHSEEVRFVLRMLPSRNRRRAGTFRLAQREELTGRTPDGDTRSALLLS